MQRTLHILTVLLAFCVLCTVSCQNKAPVHDTNTSGDNAAAEKTVNTKAADTERVVRNENSSPFLNNYILWGVADENTQNEVRIQFNKFKDAVAHYDGAGAVSLLSSASIQYYDNILSAARLFIDDNKNYKRFEHNLTPTIKTTARLAVSRLSEDYIKNASPAQLYETAFKQGWIGYKTLSTASIDHIERYEKNGDVYITADFLYDGALRDKYTSKIGFQNENGVWKIDLVPVFTGIDYAIEHMIKDNQLNPESVFLATVEDAEAEFNSEQWPVYTNREDSFSVAFPKTPVVQNESEAHVYMASHHRYGSFGVRIMPLVLPQDDPALKKRTQDAVIQAFLVPMGSERPTCRSGQSENGVDTLISCDFVIPSKQSKGKAVWVFARDKQYLVFNIARTEQYDENIAVRFVSSFEFVASGTP